MHVVVTGATGFVGRHLCEQLLKKGSQVTAISLSGSPHDIHVPVGGILKGKKCDLTKASELKKCLANTEVVDAMIHLAGRPYQRDSPSIQTYFRDNFQSTLNLLEFCRVWKINKFIFSSSYAVYGPNSDEHLKDHKPVAESEVPRPFEFYDISKYLAEGLCRFYSERFGMAIAVLRYSKIYGPGLNEGVVYEVINKALSNLPIEISGDISTDFVFINDVIKATIASLDRALKFQIYNIGSGEETTLYDLSSKVIAIAQSKSEITYSNIQKSPTRFSLDINKAKLELGYDPLPLQEGLTDFIDYLKKI